MFDGEESAHTYAIDIENPWFIASHFSFVNYIYVKDYPIGIVLLRRALEDKPQKEYSIYYGVEKTIDVWDSCVNDDGCLEDFCLRYSICLETTEYGKQSLYTSESCYQIGEHFYTEKCPENWADLAVFWYGQAAEKGNVQAVYALGYMYLYEGYGWTEIELDCGTPAIEMNTGSSEKAAEKWYKLAAEWGDAWSMYKLGCLYCFHGKDVYPKWNSSDGILWLEKAYASGIKEAAKALAEYLAEQHIDYKKCMYYLKVIEKEDSWAKKKIRKLSIDYKQRRITDKKYLTSQMREVLRGKSLDEQQEYFKIKFVERTWSRRPAKGGKEEKILRTEETMYRLVQYTMGSERKSVITIDGCIARFEYDSSDRKILLWACDDEYIEVEKCSGKYWSCGDKGGGNYDTIKWIKLVFEPNKEKNVRYDKHIKQEKYEDIWLLPDAFMCKKYGNAFAKARENAQTGDAEAICRLGEFYTKATEFDADKYAEYAKNCYETAAKKEHVRAMYFLGLCYSKTDYIQAEAWLKKAIENGYLDAYDAIICLYEAQNRNQVPDAMEKAKYWRQKYQENEEFAEAKKIKHIMDRWNTFSALNERIKFYFGDFGNEKI
ncbi:MAG: sel1 repeat family protein [Lachnospiraceae bacterium]|nr:sel1 repeat family protein [Lachnospiraceae bacterium]